MARSAGEVFTPSSPVSKAMFATRRHERLQERVSEVLTERGRQLVVFGDTGVGKTSLVRYVAAENRLRLVRVECGPTFDELIQDALGKMLGVEEMEQVRKNSTATDFSAGLYSFFSAKASRSKGTETKTRPIPRSIGGLLAEAMDETSTDVLFLDNFENTVGRPHAEDTMRSITALIKLLSDRSAESDTDPKLVVAGIPTASEALVRLDEAAARRTAQIPVGRMPDDELREIVQLGADRLNLAFDGLCIERIISLSDGFPYYTHLFCLHLARRAITEKRHEVRFEDFDGALDDILNDCDLTLRGTYRQAVETSGQVRVRKSILESVASIERREVSFRQIREAFLGIHPQYATRQQLNFLSTAIRPLKEQYGILSVSGIPKSKRNLYRFSNPLMRAYVRLQMTKEKGRQPDLI